MRRQSRSPVPAASCLVLALAAIGTIALVSAAQDVTRFDVDTRVDVGGYSLHLTCKGNGSPTVVLEAGLGAGSRSWEKVLPDVSTVTRVCSYDRPNLGRSDPAFRDVRRIGTRTYLELRSGREITQAVRTLLRNVKEASPYVFVGHSFGGLASMLYAHHYPDEIAGMVLVDSMHPDQAVRLRSLMTPAEVQIDRELWTQNREGLDIDSIAAEVRAASGRSTIPLIVLAQGRPESNPTERSTKEAQVWRELQIDLSKRSSNGRLVVAEKSGHDIHVDQPELVVAAIREVVETARTKARP